MRKSKPLKEFKEFALKGNVIDMAIGVIIGGAFGKIVTSLVNDIVMPSISLITGRISLSFLSVSVPTFNPESPFIEIKYGQFLQNTLDFFIIAISIFFVVKGINKFKKKTTKKKIDVPTKEEILLTEIRDILKRK